MGIKWDDSIREHKTTTLEPVTLGVKKYFKCSYCGTIVNPHGCARVLDYNFCPYCGRPVAESESETE
jgi:hypothetical protein